MGNRIDCCYNLRWSYQCIFPCIRFCTYTGRRVWYNYDGMELVQPLVHMYHPDPSPIYNFPDDLHGINDDEDIKQQLQSGLDSPGQLAALCKYASDHGYTIRAVGTGSSWSHLTHTRDILVDMTYLEKFLTLEPMFPEVNKKKEFVDIEVEAGMRVVDFVEKLDKKFGLALDMMGNYAGQTVGGVINTSTHGSGIFAGTLSTLVVGLHMIISGGIQVKIRSGDETIEQCEEKIQDAKYGDDPVELNSDDVLKACAVGLGSMGIIYSVTYRCVPVYNLEEIRTKIEVPWDENEEFKVPPEFAEMYMDENEGEYFSFFVNPYPFGFSDKKVHMSYLKAKRTERDPQCPACCACWCGPGGRGIAEIGFMQTDCTASCLQGCANCFPYCIPRLTNFGLDQFSFSTPYVQRWYNVLQFTKGNIHIRTAEWCLPLSDLDKALSTVIKLAQNYAEQHDQYSLLPVYVRLVKGDDLFLSPASKFRPGTESTSDHNCYIEVPFLPGAYGIEEFQETVENCLFKDFRARPHWGKNNRLNAVKLYSCYNIDKIAKWKKVFKIFNKGGLFNNLFTHNMGFDVFLDEQPTF